MWQVKLMNTENENLDFEVNWIYAQYGNGDSVTAIAVAIGKSEAYVYAKMRKKPEKYEDVKCIREETRDIRVRRISSLADRNIETYLEGLQDDPDKAGENIDKINRISKDFAHRVQLAEGKATSNIGVNGTGLPFKVTFVETYEGNPPSEEDETDLPETE
jgi:hypothetical protein